MIKITQQDTKFIRMITTEGNNFVDVKSDGIYTTFTYDNKEYQRKALPGEKPVKTHTIRMQDINYLKTRKIGKDTYAEITFDNGIGTLSYDGVTLEDVALEGAEYDNPTKLEGLELMGSVAIDNKDLAWLMELLDDRRAYITSCIYLDEKFIHSCNGYILGSAPIESAFHSKLESDARWMLLDFNNDKRMYNKANKRVLTSKNVKISMALWRDEKTKKEYKTITKFRSDNWMLTIVSRHDVLRGNPLKPVNSMIKENNPKQSVFRLTSKEINAIKRLPIKDLKRIEIEGNKIKIKDNSSVKFDDIEIECEAIGNTPLTPKTLYFANMKGLREFKQDEVGRPLLARNGSYQVIAMPQQHIKV